MDKQQQTLTFTSKIKTALTLTALIFISPSTLADIINVPADYPTIQAAIDAAQPTGDEIIVAPGTYHEAINLLGKELYLHSSAGRETTIIDGTELNISVITCHTNETPETIIEGFSITGGTGTPDNRDNSFGGGMCNYQSSPTVRDCLFFNNSISGHHGYGGGMCNRESSPQVLNCEFRQNSAFTPLRYSNDYSGGGAIANLDHSAPIIRDCLFVGNITLSDGGAIIDWEISTPIIEDCLFVGNTALGDGGALYNGNRSNATVSHTTFLDNHAELYGGAVSDWSYEGNYTNSTFEKNTAGWGGAIALRVGQWGTLSLTFESCIFRNNAAEEGGGAVYAFDLDSGPVQLVNCTFTQNHADGDGGGVYLKSRWYLEVAHCEFIENTADGNGGGLVDKHRASVHDCTFLRNSAGVNGGGFSLKSDGDFWNLRVQENTAGNGGGGIYLSDFIILRNVLCTNNSALNYGGGILIGEKWGRGVLDNCTIADNTTTADVGNGIAVIHPEASVFLRKSIIRNGVDGIWITLDAELSAVDSNIEGGLSGEGNIDADPMFVDRPNRNYRIRSGSPVIDRTLINDNSPWDFIDLDGNPRTIDDPFITNTKHSDERYLDMGAYEFQADINPTLIVEPDPLRAGEQATMTVTNSRDNTRTYLVYSLKGTGRTIIRFLNVALDLQAPKQAGTTKTTDNNGSAIWNLPIPKNAAGRKLWLQAIQLSLKTNVVATSIQ